MYTKIKIEAAPKRSRRSVARFEKTADWISMKADLQSGLAPGVGLQVLLTEEEKEKYGIRNRLSVARFVKKYLATHNLPYIVRSFRRQEGDYIIVQQKK
jgi:hypothetical protein